MGRPSVSPTPRAALLSLGAFARGRVGGAIGITGSVGKTTTKDLLAGCLTSTFRAAASEDSFNNELGLPLTLFNAPDEARAGWSSRWAPGGRGHRAAGRGRTSRRWRRDQGRQGARGSISVTSTVWPAPRVSSSPPYRHRASRY